MASDENNLQNVGQIREDVFQKEREIFPRLLWTLSRTRATYSFSWARFDRLLRPDCDDMSFRYHLSDQSSRQTMHFKAAMPSALFVPDSYQPA